MALQPRVMFAKDIFHLATMTEDCKKDHFWNLSIKSTFFVKLSKKCCQKRQIHGKIPWNLPLCNHHPWLQKKIYALWLQKDIFPFLTLTVVCKEANFIRFSHYVYEQRWLLKTCIYPWILQKKKPISFLILQSRYP